MTKKTVAKKTVSKKVTAKKEDKIFKVKISVLSNPGQDEFCLSASGKEVEIKESLKKKIESAFKKYEEVQKELAKLYYES